MSTVDTQVRGLATGGRVAVPSLGKEGWSSVGSSDEDSAEEGLQRGKCCLWFGMCRPVH